MISNIRLFVNKNEESIKNAKIIKDKFNKAGYNCVENNNYDLAVAVGGDGSFLRMVKDTNFNKDIYYVGINSGTLGFLQEVELDEIDEFIEELEEEKYEIDTLGIQESTIKHENGESRFCSFNEIEIRDCNLKTVWFDVFVNNNLLENYVGDGLCISTSMGSTAHNLSFGGSIVWNTFSSLQITSMGSIPSSKYRSLPNSIVIPEKNIIKLKPSINARTKNFLMIVDGENNYYNNVEEINTKIDDRKIKCLRFHHHTFTQKINKKFL